MRSVNHDEAPGGTYDAGHTVVPAAGLELTTYGVFILTATGHRLVFARAHLANRPWHRESCAREECRR